MFSRSIETYHGVRLNRLNDNEAVVERLRRIFKQSSQSLIATHNPERFDIVVEQTIKNQVLFMEKTPRTRVEFISFTTNLRKLSNPLKG